MIIRMKKVVYALLLSCILLGVSSCAKEDDIVGSKWQYSETETYTYDGVTYNYEISALLSFTNATSGTFTVSYVESQSDGYTDQDQENATFTYTYNSDSRKGDMTITVVYEEDGETETETMQGSFFIDEDFNKLTLSMTDLAGDTESIVLTKK